MQGFARMDRVHDLLDRFVTSVRTGAAARDDGAPAWSAILQAAPANRAAIVVTAIEALESVRWLNRSLSDPELEALLELAARVLQTSPAFDEDQLIALLDAPPEFLAGTEALACVERFIAANTLQPPLERALTQLHARLTKQAGSATTRKFATRVAAVLADQRDGPPLPIDRDAWGSKVWDRIDALDDEQRARWVTLLDHAAHASGKSKPTQRWTKSARLLIAAISNQRYAGWLQSWMETATLGYTHQPGWGPPVEVGLSDRNQDLLKGLIWGSGTIANPQLAHAVAQFGERCFRKIPNFGPASTKLGNACLHALAAMPAGVGVPHLSRLAERVRYASGKRVIDRALDDAAMRAGQTREDLEETSVPDAGLDAMGTRRIPVGEFQAELRVVRGALVELRWIRPNGKLQRSAPQPVQAGHADQLRTIKREHKQLQDLLEGQTARVQRMWMNDRRLPLRELRERYLAHPVVGQIGRGLIWLCDGRELWWQAGQLAPLGQPGAELADDAEARLWHVLDAQLDQVLIWRDFLEAHDLRQPFKQIWREVYRPHDRDAYTDDRFASHVLRQRPLLTACQQRGWRYTIQGHWDSANYPTLLLPRWNLTVVFEAVPLAHNRDDAIFEYVVAGRVSFVRADDLLIERPLRLGDIPPLVFSEVMRDVDGFVGAASIANDPRFDERDIQPEWRDYWAGAVCGELAPEGHTRRDVLARVLPRTILRDRAELVDRWLVVRGRSGSHRIHLGTGHVHRDGADTPIELTVDYDARAIVERAFLPFEGDAILINILAKAFVLADG